MQTLALIARRPDVDRDVFRKHYEQEHVPLALPLLEGLTRYVRNHVVSSVFGEEPTFDVLTEFSYRDAGAFEAVVNRLASAEGEGVSQDELRFMDKEKNVFFGVEKWAGWGAEKSAEAQKVALLTMRRPREDYANRMSMFQDFMNRRFAKAQGWTLWETYSMGSEPPVEAVAFAWFEPGAIDLARIEGAKSVLGEGFLLSVDEFRS